MLLSLPFQLLLSVIFGAIIGLEREHGEGEHPSAAGGIRTFSLACLLGAIAGIFYTSGALSIFLLISCVFSVLLVANYVLGASLTQRAGLTTELSFFYTFLIGFLTTTTIIPLQIVIAIFVIIMLILAFKGKSKQIISGVSRYEIESFISYAIIALVVLPFLPNVGYTLSDVPFISTMLEGFGVDLGKFATLELLNPRKIWFVVVLVTGIDVFGYLLSKFIGSKSGFTLTSFIAGFISSTSTTISLAQRSKKLGVVNYLVGAALLANLASFFQIFLLVGPINPRWLVSITPTILIMIGSTAVLSVLFLRKEEAVQKKSVTEEVKETKIFSLYPAIRFALLLIVVKLITKISLILFGNTGFLISSIIASLAGIDAIVLNLADMAGKTISYPFALLVFILVSGTNLASKAVYSYMQGSKNFALKFTLAAAVVVAVSFAGLLLV